MSDYNSTFKRIEKKYRITRARRRAVEAASAGHMHLDGYGRTTVISLYLDTPHRDLIARSIEKPLYKEKLRLRTYGRPDGEALMVAFTCAPLVREAGMPALSDEEIERRAAAGVAAANRLCPGSFSRPEEVAVFFGIKKKFKGVVYKRRLVLSLPAALAFVSGLTYEQSALRWPLANAKKASGAHSPQVRQIARELEAAMNRHEPLLPSMGISCDREAWAVNPDGGREGVGCDPNLRITYDDRLEYFDCFAAPGAADWQPIIGADESIMEIKCAGAYDPWLVRTLSAEAIYPISFTKYGTAYRICEQERCPTKAVEPEVPVSVGAEDLSIERFDVPTSPCPAPDFAAACVA